MATWSRLQKIALISLGAVGGSVAYYQLNYGNNVKKYDVHNSWTTNFTPSVKWDRNWDHREPESIVKPLKYDKDPVKENEHNEKLEKAKSTATRHLFLIRHGQYNVGGETDKERFLTELGQKQADLTGQRLASLNIKWDLLVKSTMTRAQETGNIIAKHLDKDIPTTNCQLIEEGAPIPPEPPVGHWRPEPRFFQDSARIEAGFRRYFYRAPPEQKQDTYTLLVCHANVIRYFVCKALQFPPEGWLRISLNHGSITWVSILPNGNVVLRSLSDSGYMDPKNITSR